MHHFKPMFDDSGEALNLYLDTAVGTQIKVESLIKNYDAVAFCTGMSNSKRNWPSIKGSYGAEQFVGWYNNSPEFKDLHMGLAKARHVVIVGNGNVALDIVRLLARPAHSLENTDINPRALMELKESSIEKITIMGRRGPLEV
jgi:NADPH-dependent glutamate synthase beta subunit-like oxidoreductase